MIELVSTLDEKNFQIWNVSISSKIIHTCINDLKSCLFFVAGINIPEGQSSEQQWPLRSACRGCCSIWWRSSRDHQVSLLSMLVHRKQDISQNISHMISDAELKQAHINYKFLNVVISPRNLFVSFYTVSLSVCECRFVSGP